MPQSNEQLASMLNDRKGEPVFVSPASCLLPENNCHLNVAAYLKDHSECTAARGWLIEEVHGGLTLFYRHSVVRQKDGTLLDPTRLVRQYPFLEHDGTADEFDALPNMVQYPPPSIELENLSAETDYYD